MLWWLAQNTVSAGVLTGLVALVCRSGRLGPSVRHALWLVVLVRLMIPPVVSWPSPFGVLERPADAQALGRPSAATAGAAPEVPRPGPARAALTAEVVVPAGLLPEGQGDDAVGAEPAPAAAPAPPPPDAAVGTARPAAWLAPLLLGGWVAAALGMGLVQAVRILRFRALLGRAQPPPPELAAEVARVATAFRVRRVACLVVPEVISPALWSWGRPLLVWPAALLGRLPPRNWPSVIAHELAHLRRRDHWVGWLLLAAECGWWWNPVFWLVRRRLRLEAELACDAWVVGLLPQDRRAYAEALLEVSQWISQTAAPVPVWGMGPGPRQTFERRLTMILCDRVPCRMSLLGLAATGLVAFAILPSWSQDTKPSPTPVGAAPLVGGVGDAAAARYAADDVINVLAEPAGTDAPSARDRQLEELENKLKDLLKEVHSLRNGKGPAAKGGPPADTVGNAIRYLRFVEKKEKLAPAAQEKTPVVTLTRATYRLPKAKVDALATLLREHVKVAVLETKADADSLTVTTTPEAQHSIGQFIDFMEGRHAPAMGGTMGGAGGRPGMGGGGGMPGMPGGGGMPGMPAGGGMPGMPGGGAPGGKGIPPQPGGGGGGGGSGRPGLPGGGPGVPGQPGGGGAGDGSAGAPGAGGFPGLPAGRAPR
jgi:beta-lactamase regulating signal transducer with metallopeptidase domain